MDQVFCRSLPELPGTQRRCRRHFIRNTVPASLRRFLGTRAFAPGARVFHVRLQTPPLEDPVSIRPTESAPVVQGSAPVIAALASGSLVVHVTVEGMLHEPKLPATFDGGSRLLMISNEHPEILERCMPNPALRPSIDLACK